MTRHFKKPQNKSVSRTSTFTRLNVRPEEYVEDPEFQSENVARIQQLRAIAEENTPRKGLLSHIKARRKKANANSLLKVLAPQTSQTLERNSEADAAHSEDNVNEFLNMRPAQNGGSDDLYE